MSEQPIVAAKASVMLYDDVDKKWIPGGSSPGIAKVNIYHHTGSNAFRVVGRKLQDHEVVVNCAIFIGLKYNRATPTFHQWRDSKQVYGLNFISKEDADRFAEAMGSALDSIAGKQLQKMSVSTGAGDISAQSNGNNQSVMCNSAVTAGECFNSTTNHFSNTGTMNGASDGSGPEQMRLGQPPTREEYRSHKRQSSAGRALDLSTSPTALLSDNQMTCSAGPINQSSTGPINQSGAVENSSSIPQAPPPPKAPPPPAAPPLPEIFSAPRATTGRQGPAIPAKSSSTPPVGGSQTPGVTGGGKAPIAPPTPPPVNSLANALKSAQLRKVTKDEVETPTPGVVTGRSASISSPLSADIMSEMARKLRDRRAKADGETVNEGDGELNHSTDGAVVSNRSVACAVDSPRIDRSKRFQSLTGQETFHHVPITSLSSNTVASGARQATTTDIETMKQEIIAEARRAIQSAKQEIIDVIRTEMARK